MGDYVEKNNKTVEKIQIIEKSTNNQINVDDLANAVLKALKSGDNGGFLSKDNKEDTFDDSGTMEKLAESMLVQRGKNESNFEDLGEKHETQRSIIDTNKTIDLLSGLED